MAKKPVLPKAREESTGRMERVFTLELTPRDRNALLQVLDVCFSTIHEVWKQGDLLSIVLHVFHVRGQLKSNLNSYGAYGCGYWLQPIVVGTTDGQSFSFKQSLLIVIRAS